MTPAEDKQFGWLRTCMQGDKLLELILRPILTPVTVVRCW